MSEQFKRAVVYARVSTVEQAGERNVSLDVQKERFAAVCRERRFVPIGEYVDVYSGRKDARRQYQAMIAAARKHELDVIVVQFLDRFGRNPREILRRWWELEELGVERIVTDEDVREELVLLIRAGLAGKESEKTGLRVIGAMERVAREGRWPGKAPYGYRLVTDPSASNFGKLLVDEREAEVVRRMFRIYATGRDGFLSIARAFNAERIPAPRAGVWWANMAQKMLRNTAYVGRPVWRRIVIPGGCPAIVDAELWEAVQQRLKARSVGWSRQPPMSPFLLTGLVRCGCGSNRHAWTSRENHPDGRRRTPIRYYRCGRMRSTGLCNARDVRAQRLEEWVVEQVRGWTIPALDLAAVDDGEAARRADLERERSRLRAVIERAKRRRESNYDDYADRTIDRQTFQENDARYRGELAAADSALGGLRDVTRATNREAARSLVDFQARVDHLTPEELRGELAELVESVIAAGPTSEDWRIVPRADFRAVLH